MVTIIPKVSGFSERIGTALGGGIQQGMAKAQEFIEQMQLEKFKQEQRKKLIEEVESGQSDENQQKFQEEGMQNEALSKGNELQRGSDPLAKAKKYAAMGEHELARTATEEAKMERKSETEKQGRHYEIAKKSLEHAGELARTLPQKEAALESMKDAIKSNNLSYFSPDNIAELTGIDAFRSPEGAAFKTASKEFFLGNTLRVGAKGLNQWFEKQVLEMGPKIGRSTPANLAVTEMLDMEMDIQKKEIELTNRIADEMESKPGGFIKRDLPQKIQTELSKYAIQRQKEAKSAIEEIKDRYEPVNKSGHLMRDPSGALRRVNAKDFKAAKQAGYTVAQ